MENEKIETMQILSDIDETTMAEITQAAKARLDEIQKNLIERSSVMEGADLYKKLIDYCCEKVGAYISDPANMKKVLTDSTNIEGIFNEMTASEEFKAMSSKEYMGMPRIVAMSILTGAESAAVNEAAEILKDRPQEEVDYLDGMAAKYKGYMQDAIAYATGNKTVNVMGN